MPSWDFLRHGPAILPASNMADPLSGTLETTDILVREAVQNSLDERRPDNPSGVRVRFERLVLLGDAKARFVKHLHLESIAERTSFFRSDNRWFRQGQTVLDQIDDPDAGLPLLIISDHGTNGLGGSWYRSQSRADRFFNLVLSIAGSQKQAKVSDGDRALGSYGYGKMAFAMSSSLRTVIYYSTFLTDPGTDGTRCRAMACGYFPYHTMQDTDYAGQAYFGAPTPDDHHHILRSPLLDDEGHRWIDALGLPTRATEDTGTTVILPAADLAMGDIVESCHKWWWPRAFDTVSSRRPTFEFIEAGAESATFVPRSRPALNPFIDCFKLLNATDAGRGFEIKRVTAGQHRRNVGRLILRALPEDGVDRDDPAASVALIREGLVIRYEESFLHEDKAPVVGIFIPHGDVTNLFILSEPPAHDEWRHNNHRLLDAGDDSADLIRLTKNRIRILTRDFQARQMISPSSDHADAARFLQKTLGSLFRAPGGPRSKSRRKPKRPVAFVIQDHKPSRHETDQGMVDRATFTISLSDNVPDTTVPVRITVNLSVLVDADGGRKEQIPCEIVQHGESAAKTGGHEVTAALVQGDHYVVTAQAAVHPEWRTLWAVTVQKDAE